ncbi:MAG: hypothetical protein DRO40_08140 [Thermoprotei archaeon]|nr:MAG: hypothetical protein DRO40_08140 [Thermoprotei archaeon]
MTPLRDIIDNMDVAPIIVESENEIPLIAKITESLEIGYCIISDVHDNAKKALGYNDLRARTVFLEYEDKEYQDLKDMFCDIENSWRDKLSEEARTLTIRICKDRDTGALYSLVSTYAEGLRSVHIIKYVLNKVSRCISLI